LRTHQLELLRPDEILAERERISVAYLPLGPLEWHGPHNAVGLDALNAEAVARNLAERLGGIVVPTLFWGTECLRDEHYLKSFGFGPEEKIIGMDFPKNTLSSAYIEEEAFCAAIAAYVDGVTRMGFRLIVLLNGHGAEGQLRSMERVASSRTVSGGLTVLPIFTLMNLPDCASGHATKLETSILMSLHPEAVDLALLPTKKEVPHLAPKDFGIMEGFCNSICEDPRDADPKYGREHMEKILAFCEEKIRGALLTTEKDS